MRITRCLGRGAAVVTTAAGLLLSSVSPVHAAGSVSAGKYPSANYSACASVNSPTGYLITATLVMASAQTKLLATTATPSGSDTDTGSTSATVCVPGGFVPYNGVAVYQLSYTVTSLTGLGAAVQPGALTVECTTVLNTFRCSPNTTNVPLIV